MVSDWTVGEEVWYKGEFGSQTVNWEDKVNFAD